MMNRIERAAFRRSETSDDREKILSFEETREYLGVSAPTLRRFLTTGKIKGTKIGRRWFVLDSALKIAIDPSREIPLN